MRPSPTPLRLALASAAALASVAAVAAPAGAAGVPAAHTTTPTTPSTPTTPTTPTTAYVDVAVATVWTSPDSPRPVDKPALTDPVHPRQWLADMTLDQKRDLTSSNVTQTQTLYGRRVRILDSEGDWYKVAVPGQATPKNSLGYPGWIPKSQLTRDPSYGRALDARPVVQVDRATTTWLYGDAGRHRKKLQVSAGTRLPELARTRGAVLVGTPDDKPAWISARDVHVRSSADAIPTPTGADVVTYAKSFLDTPYVWGGRSGFGLDCSGFTSSVYQTLGLDIPRDAQAQAQEGGGRPVAVSDLRPGDLLFYAHDSGSIYHVAMYVGDGRMIEAYDAATPVRITEARLDGDYWGARRFLAG
ncbi:C40 family peptidase [Streptomyces reniochalinae]|uniref:NlpC/P60 family protein n=1 Tax=Streptomyces reniochalinae TaxID=2250578 RepID=A0A367EE38_9ACTN|nr:C40 family peptidase [Streptomyces reniochalinae]RCG15992.1 NlpC/P60 family protein [Streptomyces reniochalinae]